MAESSEGATLRQVMRSYPTGVTVVASHDEAGAPFGVTVNSFTSVSLDPPLVSVCIGHGSTWHPALVATGSFAVSILASDQGEVAMRFASEPSEGRFDGVAFLQSGSGDPIVEGALGWLDCGVERVIEVGDHSVLIGRVRSAGVSDGHALLFHRGRLGTARE